MKHNAHKKKQLRGVNFAKRVNLLQELSEYENNLFAKRLEISRRRD